jgi:hypothetical protein
MSPRSRPRVLKHCPEGHIMEMLWRTCPQCTGEPPVMQPEPRAFSDATRIIEPAQVAQALATAEPATTTATAWWLVVAEGILPGKRVQLQGKGVRVGRLPSRAGGQEPFELPDTHLSRDHFALVPAGEGWVVHDLGSTNGTKVNGEKVNRREVVAGDEVRAGHTVFRIETGPEESAG